jgi:type IV pilus assembly protein PilA
MKHTIKKFTQDESGMTLVELLATIVILAVIAAIGVVAIGAVIQNSREDSAVSNVQQAYAAAQTYQLDTANDSKADFTLGDLIDSGQLTNVTGWAATATDKTNSNVKFTVDDKGNLTMEVPAQVLKAGKKDNKAISIDPSGATAGAFKGSGDIKRGDLF